MPARTTKTFSVDGTRTLLLPSGPMLVHAIIRERDFTHNRLAGFAHTMEDAKLWAASADLLEALEELRAIVDYTRQYEQHLMSAGTSKGLDAAFNRATAAIAKAKP